MTSSRSTVTSTDNGLPAGDGVLDMPAPAAQAVRAEDGDGRSPRRPGASSGAPPLRTAISPRALALAGRLRARRAIDIARRQQPLRSEHVAVGLKRDLHHPFRGPDAKIPVRVRPLRAADLPALVPAASTALPAEERGDLLNRTVLANAGVGHGFVAEAEDGHPCYVQWLLGPEDLERVRWHFGDLLPRLEPGEMLLEGAYTPAAYRGQGIMPHAMAKIAEEGAAFGARWVVTFTGESNIASIKGCRRAGFLPYIRRLDRWFGLHRTLASLPPSPEPDR